jgi:hypothetical protein
MGTVVAMDTAVAITEAIGEVMAMPVVTVLVAVDR